MSKQTAVEWLIVQIKNDHIQKALTRLEWMEIFEQAKVMEREQMGLPNCKQIDGINSITIIDPATGKVLGKGGEQ